MAVVELPSVGEIADELLLFLRGRARALKAREVYRPLGTILKLSPQQRALKRATTDESLWHNYVQSAREHMCKAGYMPRKPYDSWRLTELGEKKADVLLQKRQNRDQEADASILLDF